MPFVLYLTAGLITGYHVYTLLLWAVWGAPTHLSQYVSLLGSLLMALAAYVSLFRLRFAAGVALTGSLLAWCFYGPAVFASISTWDIGQRPRYVAVVLAAGATTLLVSTTAHSIAACLRRFESSILFPLQASRSMRLVVSVCTLLAFMSMVVAAVTFYSHIASRHPSRYLIPQGYVGWVEIQFDVVGAPSIPIRDGFLVFNLDRACVYKTSSSLEYGWAQDEYFYYDSESRRKLPLTGWGGGGLVWGQTTEKSSHSDGRTEIKERFFVGTEGQFRDEDHYPKPRDCTGKD